MWARVALFFLHGSVLMCSLPCDPISVEVDLAVLMASPALEFLRPCTQVQGRGGHVHRDMAPRKSCTTGGTLDGHGVSLTVGTPPPPSHRALCVSFLSLLSLQRDDGAAGSPSPALLGDDGGDDCVPF